MDRTQIIVKVHDDRDALRLKLFDEHHLIAMRRPLKDYDVGVHGLHYTPKWLPRVPPRIARHELRHRLALPLNTGHP
jgi:hypothetical protein